VAVKVADLLANRDPGEAPLDPADIRNVFVLESSGPVHLWVDGIRLQCAFNTEPEWWQPDKTCDLRPRITGRQPSTAATASSTNESPPRRGVRSGPPGLPTRSPTGSGLYF